MILNKLRHVPALLVVGLLAAGAVLTGSNPGSASPDPPDNAKADDGKAPAPPVVQVVRPQKGGLDRVSRQACTAEPAQQVDLFAGVAGRITHVGASLGDRVKAGQVLAEIDAPGLALDREQAVAGSLQAMALQQEARARLKAADADVDAAKGVIKQRQAEEASAKAMVALREKQSTLLKEVVARGGAGQDDVLKQEALLLAAKAAEQVAAVGVENAKADHEVRQRKLAEVEAAIETAKANLKAAEVAVRRADLALTQTKVTSPIDGVVTQAFHRTGEYVRPADAGARPLFVVIRADVIRVVTEVAQQDIARAELGLPVEVEFFALPDARFAGKISRTGFVIDPKTGTMRAEVSLPNPEGKLRPGMAGVATLQLGKGPADALRLPKQAVVRVQRNQPGKSEWPDAVYVYRDGKARLTQVGVTNRDGDTVEIASGLTTDDQVVSDPKRIPEPRLFGEDIPVRLAPPK
jgi:RND family efflux transporter MFP subunit